MVSAGLSEDKAQLALASLLDKELEFGKRSLLSRVKLSLSKKKGSAGLYIWGGVGRGKSMLISLFIEYCTKELDIGSRIAVFHFHAFMKKFHEELLDIDSTSRDSELAKICSALLGDAEVLCLDELQINNIADAMIIGSIFEHLFKLGIKVVITSNRPPEDLYKDGLQRDRFIPFIEMIQAEMKIFHLNNHTDYRLKKATALNKVFFLSNKKRELKEYEELIFDISGGHEFSEIKLNISKNNILSVGVYYGRIARFSFDDLCLNPYGVAEYTKICDEFSVIIIDKIPKLSEDNHNEVLRFITLIDMLYQKHILLICSIATMPDRLYKSGKNSFEFRRTASRLQELQSEEYISKTNSDM